MAPDLPEDGLSIGGSGCKAAFKTSIGEINMDLSLGGELVKVPDLRHELRQLKYFRASFKRAVALFADKYGVVFDIDEARLVEAFFNWIEAFRPSKSYAAINREDLIVFAAALLLRELLRLNPVFVKDATKRDVPGTEPTASIIGFWPEGLLFTNFCLSGVNAIMEQEFRTQMNINPNAQDLRTWWSFRENVAENPSYAICFFDHFVGKEPNWMFPDSVVSRASMQVDFQQLPQNSLEPVINYTVHGHSLGNH